MNRFYVRSGNLLLSLACLISLCSVPLAAECHDTSLKTLIAQQAGAKLEGSASPAEQSQRALDGQAVVDVKRAETEKPSADQAATVSGDSKLLKFRVRLTAAVDGSVAKVGDPVYGELLDTVLLPGGVFAGTGAPVFGVVTEVVQSKSVLKSNFQKKNWRNANGNLSIKITKIGNTDLTIDAAPAPKSVIERANSKAVPLTVDDQGEVVIRYNAKGYTAANLALNGGCMAAGPFGLLLGPIVGGAAGAADPAFAYGRPVTEDEGHTRVKGFFKGMIGGLPGGFLLTDSTSRGLNISLSPGDVLVFQERAPEKDQAVVSEKDN